jgi:hypothetical protein
MSSKDGLQLGVQRRITALLAANTGLEKVLQRILRDAVNLCNAHMTEITLLVDAGQELEVIGAFGRKAPTVGERLAVNASLCGLVLSG